MPLIERMVDVADDFSADLAIDFEPTGQDERTISVISIDGVPVMKGSEAWDLLLPRCQEMIDGLELTEMEGGM